VEPLAQDLHKLAVEIGKALETQVSSQNVDGNDVQSDAHYQISNPDHSIELEQAVRESLGATAELPKQVSKLPLGMILKACPDIGMYNRSGIKGWPDLISTASTVRGALGISPSAWDEARLAMGEVDAAVTVAAILQRAEEITSPGGYLRGLTSRAQEGKFSTGPMILALMRKAITPHRRAHDRTPQ
jgi:replication initiation protein RepC